MENTREERTALPNSPWKQRQEGEPWQNTESSALLSRSAPSGLEFPPCPTAGKEELRMEHVSKTMANTRATDLENTSPWLTTQPHLPLPTREW